MAEGLYGNKVGQMLWHIPLYTQSCCCAHPRPVFQMLPEIRKQCFNVLFLSLPTLTGFLPQPQMQSHTHTQAVFNKNF